MAETPQEFIDRIINNAIQKSDDLTNAATTNANAIVTEASGYYVHTWNPPALPDPQAIEPNMWITPGASLQLFEAYRDDICDKLTDNLANFILTYFPLSSDAYDEATAWLVNAITNGGTGIPIPIENAIWQRARDRLIDDAVSAESQLIEGAAARGMRMIDGAVSSTRKEIHKKRIQETGQQSTQIGAKQAEIEIENIRFAVEQALKQRTVAVAAATDYIRALVAGIGSAIDVASLDGEKRSEMMNAVATLYRARLSRDELIINSRVTKRGQDRAHWVDKDNSHWKSIDSKVSAAASAADVFARTAQAALASLNTITSTATSAFS